ncbi:hypothetical protein XarbCFBP7408_02900 [Xanthomonas arboricola pv. guizotiae]|uniref:Uncharacterized protein n=1 Tax=Xanthomonas arboricola pv. guizotiae TaxID=487867 RepID=A0A2S7A7G8_9XANT|nr:hypothetical protein XarbCFBP7409_01380 [Xanthomonas arboricola pv. guizotiae]PPU26601.1 hypothetical protein XarbCFBP7408_02900 [Xanthomonas arboricola pv. guizotiae]
MPFWAANAAHLAERAAVASPSTGTYVSACHRRSTVHMHGLPTALHGATAHCARRAATRHRSAKNGGDTRSLNFR